MRLFTILLALLVSPTAGADLVELTFQQGDGGTASDTDATLILDAFFIVPPDPETVNFGSEPALSVQLMGPGSERRALVAFRDIFGPGADQIPAGSTIVFARLTLRTTSTGGSLGPILAHRVLSPWDETVVTWDGFNDGGVAGVDYEAAVLDAFTPLSGDAAYSLDITDAVVQWSAGAANHGVILVTTTNDLAQFHSDDVVGGAIRRPELLVRFEAPVTVPLTSSTALITMCALLAALGAWRIGYAGR